MHVPLTVDCGCAALPRLRADAVRSNWRDIFHRVFRKRRMCIVGVENERVIGIGCKGHEAFRRNAGMVTKRAHRRYGCEKGLGYGCTNRAAQYNFTVHLKCVCRSARHGSNDLFCMLDAESYDAPATKELWKIFYPTRRRANV